MNYTIKFQSRQIFSQMCVSPLVDVTGQIQDLKNMGYRIEDVTPPLDGYPTQYLRAPRPVAGVAGNSPRAEAFCA